MSKPVPFSELVKSRLKSCLFYSGAQDSQTLHDPASQEFSPTHAYPQSEAIQIKERLMGRSYNKINLDWTFAMCEIIMLEAI